MTVKILFTPRIRRIACAILASLVTTFVALYVAQRADAQTGDAATGCALHDVAIWQTQLADPVEEATPAYILRVTEAFLTACPDRPEIHEARKIAGIAAVESGLAKTAITHFQQAGWLHDSRAQFLFATALLADGQTQQAWSARDTAVANWLDRLSFNPLVDVETTTILGGTLHAVRFMRPDQSSGIRAAWVAVPDGGGWPATLTIGADRQITAFHRLRAGADAPELHHIDLYRCRSRRLLARAETPIPVSEMAAAAALTMIGYLSDPDLLEPTGPGKPLATCVWPQRLLPRPGR